MKDTILFHSSSHEPYFEYEDGRILPIFGFKSSSNTKYEPLVPDDDGSLVLASSLGSGQIITSIDEDKRELLYG